MKKPHIATSLALALVMTSILAACSSGTKKDQPATPATANPPSASEYKGGPAELLVLDVNTGTTDEQFKSFFVDPIKAKYPQINLVKSADTLDKLLAAGTPPDLVLVSNASLATVLEANIPEDLTQMIKTYGVNLSQMEQAVVQQMQKLGDQKAFYGLPFYMNYGAMVYNKDIFDKFGVPYPKETLNYDELLEVGKKLTRTDGGTDYIGVMPPDLRQMYWQYGVPIVDKATGKAKLTTDKHAQVFSLLKQFYMIPGYLQNGNHSHSVDLFFKEQRMAMYPNWVAAMITFFTRAGTKDSFKWDVMAHPSYPDRPGLGKEVDFAIAVVNKSSKYREAAYQVLLSLLSENVQTKQSKAGRLSVLKNEDIREVYGSDSDIYKGKNLQSIFKVTPSPLPDASKYDPKINALLIGEIVKSVTVGGTDINTALRNAEDKANKEIVIP
ncbi:ABC transporter substrate-binding protein [Paenibacillus ginsengarvi]|uniref:Extracellular solute-binding protein n=1 Tax=Paenibacillus ginsengarvi TaxID=400777 RepID=A0A3B0C8E7_9BACL|nr:extracellular solute-binding protein [Paenibacillus ginsengarvi]RKN80718.1 extracellular solute-binding protein [Paenibacillus ginsengarvi]